mgnify:CR=1 FL=1
MLKYIIFVTEEKVPELKVLETQCKEKEVGLFMSLPEEETLISETLYITDHEEICRQLLEEKANVLVWLHGNNRNMNFSMAPYAMENIEELDFVYAERIWQRFQNLPWMIAETERCFIREMTEDDLDAVYKVYEGESVTKYMEGLYEDYQEELEYTRSYIQNAYRFWGYGTWIIESKTDHKVIGRIGFNLRDGYEEPEIGFVIMEEEQQKGYAYECCIKALQVGKEEYEFEKIQALVKEGNISSINLCYKLGFQLMGKIREGREEYLRFFYTIS